MAVVKTERLTKVYRSGEGIWDIDLEVHKGEIFGFLGSNGAGKTTTIRVLLGLLHPTSGRAQVLGTDPLENEGIATRREVGYLPGELALYERHTGATIVEFFARNMGGEMIYQEEVMEALSFPRKDLQRKVGEYSRGMKQKLGLIIALQHRPRILFVDEPTTGLDPLIQLQVYGLFRDYVGSGGTVFMSSHNLSEVERVCNRVAIIRKGKMVALEEVNNLASRRIYNVEFSLKEELSPDELQEMGLKDLIISQKIVKGKISGRPDPFFRELLQKGTIEDLQWERGRLEDLFLEYYRSGEGEGQ